MFRGIFILGLFISVTSGQETLNIAALVNCSSTDSLVSGMQKCLDVYSVPITIPSAQELLDDVTAVITALVQQMDKETTMTLCRPENKENYISSTLCILSVAKKCSSGVDPVLDAMLGSPDTIRQQVEFQCQSLTDFDQACAASKVADLQNCVNTSTILDQVNSIEDPDALTTTLCLTAQLSRVCAARHLAECGQQTLQIYLQQLPPIPDECFNFTETNTTSQCRNVAASYLSCQVSAGLFIPLPQNLNSEKDILEYTLKTITEDRGSEVCSALSKYETLVNCTLSVQAQCTPDSEKQTLPDIQAVQKGLKQTCSSGFNRTCISSNLANLTETSASETQSTTNMQAMCSELKERNRKRLEAVKSCGGPTVSLYTELLTSQLPVQCTTTTPVVGSTEFPRRDVNTGSITSLSPAILVTVLFALIFQ